MSQGAPEGSKAASRPVPTTRATYGTLPGRVRRLAARAETIGFDVFDTVLRRRVEPEMVKDLVAKRLARVIAGFPTHVPLDDVRIPDWRLIRHRRRVLELDIGREHEAQGHDHEFRLRPMLARWCAELGGRAAAAGVAEDLARFEMSLERAATFPARDIRRALEAASPRRLVWISDSYMDAADIWDLLRAHGLAEYFSAGYVSSRTLRTKRTGRLFAEVLDREVLTPDRFAFVGDNPYSDADAPGRLGIRTVLVADRREAARRTRLRVLEDAAGRSTFFAGNLAREIIETAPASPRTSGCPHEALGRLLAPAFLTFTLHVLERAEASGAGRVYFFAREGLMFLRIYRRVVKALGIEAEAPRGVYLAVSRASTFLASMAGLNAAELRRMWMQYRGQSLERLCRNLTLPLEALAPIAAEHGWADAGAPVEDPGAGAFASFLADPRTQEVFTRHRDGARALLRAYLRQKGFFDHPRAAIVDIGWKGSIQSNIFRSIHELPECPTIEGIYFALAYPLEDRDPRSIRHGFFADTRVGDWVQDCIFKNGPVFEMFTTAPHGGTIGYRVVRAPSGPRLKPVIRAEHAEARNFGTYFPRVFRGIERGVRDALAVAPLIDWPTADLRPYFLDQLRRYILYPTGREARAFLRYSHVENFGVYKVATYRFNASRKRVLFGGRPWGAPARLLDALRTQFWPEAIVRRSRVPFATFAYDILETRRASRHIPA